MGASAGCRLQCMGGAERVPGTWRWASRAFRDRTGSLSVDGAGFLRTTDLQDALGGAAAGAMRISKAGAWNLK